MKKIIMFIVVLLFLSMWHPRFCTANTCQLTTRAEDDDTGPAKLFGDPVTVPALHLRFMDGKTNKEVAPSKISIIYEWEWLKYPYPERSWGVWYGARDLVECIEPGSEVLVPEFEVQPRGWYDGKYAKFPFVWKRPSFTEIGIVMYDVGCSTTRTKISPNEVAKLKKNNSVIIKINCAGHSSIIIK